MDLSYFDARTRAEDGVFTPLRDPYTDEPLGEGDAAPGFVVKGRASKSVQSAIAKLVAKSRHENIDAEDQTDVEAQHQYEIDVALILISEARNMEWNGTLVKGDDLIRKVLDGTFPDIGKDDDGKVIQRNRTFARQVIDAAEDNSNFLPGPVNG